MKFGFHTCDVATHLPDLHGVLQWRDGVVELELLQFCHCTVESFYQVLGSELPYFIDLHSLCVFIEITSYNKLSLNRQFLGCEAEGLLSDVETYAFHFEENASWGHWCDPSCGITLTFTHTYVSGLAGDGFVGEDAYPHLSFTLHVSVDGDTGSLDLPAVDPFGLKGLDAERTEGELCTSVGVAFVSTSVLRSSIFNSFWL